MRFKAAVISALLIAGTAYSSGDINIKIAGSDSKGPYLLGYNHIIVGSERIGVNNQLLEFGQDYRIDYNAGFIILADDLPSSDTLNITFTIVPIDIKKSYIQRRPIAFTETYSDTILTKPETQSRSISSDLDVTGSKSFAVNIGNIGEPSLTQSLDLSITGKLARDVYVSGSISDNNLSSSSSSGGTESLDELDKIFLTVQGKHFQSDFGDLELDGIDNSLLDYERKLTGLDVVVHTGNYTGEAALAFSPGEQVEFNFYGTDGKQGPYFLDDEESATTLSSSDEFLPGTEDVYLNGTKLERGSEHDYTIDYYDGYIQFTSKNIITSNSRVTVKIQYSSEGYRRSFYNVSSTAGRDWNINAQYIGEHDDEANPRNFEMDETARNAIQNAGEDSDSAYVSGAEYVGAGKGDYVLAADSLGLVYYNYVGSDSGDYEVSFSNVGSGNGAYEYTSTGKYLYVGSGNGGYLPVIYYPLPESSDYGSIIINKKGNLYLQGELALSRYDRNTLSSADELRNGIGLLTSGGWKLPNVSLLNRTFEADLIHLKIRSLDAEFTTPGLVDEVDFYRQYNIPQSHTSDGEKLFELSSALKAQTGEYLQIGGGIFDDDDYKSHRSYGNLILPIWAALEYSGDIELAQSEYKSDGKLSDWNSYSSRIGVVDGVIRPKFTYEYEHNDGLYSGSDAYKAGEYEIGTDVYFSKKITTSSAVSYRQQQYTDSLDFWKDEFDRYKIEQNIKYGAAGAPLNAEINYSRLYQKEYYPSADILVRNMGDLKINYNAKDFTITYYESINGVGSVSKTKEYVYVGEGNGDYRLDGEDYIAETGGDYILVVSEADTDTDDTAVGYEITGGLRLTINGRALSSDPILDRLSFDSDLTHETDLNSNASLGLKHLSIINSYDEDEMTYKTYNYRQRMTARLNAAGDYIRHTYNISKSNGSDYLYENLNDHSNSNAVDLNILSRSTVGFAITGETSTQKKSAYSGNVDLKTLALKLVTGIRIAKYFKVDLPIKYSGEKEKIKDQTIDSYSAGMQTTINIQQYGRFAFDGTYTRVETKGSSTVVSYLIAGGNKTGDNYLISGSARFKLNSYSQVEFKYSYKKLGDGYSNKNLRIEARAEF